MNNQSNGTGLPGILKNLGTMTAIRDTFLLEQSLLRTLGPLLGVLETSLYRIDDNGKVVRALHHARFAGADTNGAQQTAERVEVEEVSNAQDLPDDIRELLENEGC